MGFPINYFEEENELNILMKYDLDEKEFNKVKWVIYLPTSTFAKDSFNELIPFENKTLIY